MHGTSPYDPPRYPPDPSYPPPPHYVDTSAQDVIQLKNLAIGFYVFGALQLLGGLLTIVYFVVAGVLAGGAMASSSSSAGAGEAAFLGGILLAVLVVTLLFAGGFGGLLMWAGRSLQTQRRHTLCMVAAVILCLSFPLGTILGVWTLIVLSKPQIRALFT
jgi:hypothetical protein